MILLLSLDPVVAIHKEEGHHRDCRPDHKVQGGVNLDPLVLGDVEQVARHQTDDVALVPPAPGRKVPSWKIVRRGKGMLVIVRIVFVPIIASINFIRSH